MTVSPSNAMRFGKWTLAFFKERHKFQGCGTYALRLESK
jgi:hypothetical protein